MICAHPMLLMRIGKQVRANLQHCISVNSRAMHLWSLYYSTASCAQLLIFTMSATIVVGFNDFWYIWMSSGSWRRSAQKAKVIINLPSNSGGCKYNNAGMLAPYKYAFRMFVIFWTTIHSSSQKDMIETMKNLPSREVKP